MAAITASGSGSGLDIENIITKLTEAERAPADARFQKQETRIQGSLTAYNTLKAQLLEFKKTFSSMTSLTTVANRTVTTSNSSLFSATATNIAAISSSSVSVERLASAHKIASTGYASPDAGVGTGTMTITSGSNSFTVAITSPDNNTLGGIRDAINASSDNTSVTASILTVYDAASGGNVSKLILTSDNTGKDNAITVAVTGDADSNDTDAAGLSALSYPPADPAASAAMKELNVAQDAYVKIDGFDVYSSTNTVKDAIQGVTLNLQSASPGTAATVKVGYDRSSVVAKLKDFVTGFNTYKSTMKLLMDYDLEKKQSSLLTGDFTARSIDTTIKRIVSSSVDGATGDYTSLSSLGVTTKRDGMLDIDLDKLDKAVQSDFDGVANMLAGTNGVMKTLSSTIDSMTGLTGNIANRVKSLNTQISDINDRRAALDVKMGFFELKLRKTYTNLDLAIGQMKSTGDYVSQQMEIAKAGLTRN